MPHLLSIKSVDHLYGRPGWLFEFAYNEETIEALQRAIPYRDPWERVNREWRPTSKAWWVWEGYTYVLAAQFGNWASMTTPQGELPL